MCTSSGQCDLSPGCGNGRVDSGEACDIGGAGPGSNIKWTSTTCDSSCQPRIYVSNITHTCSTGVTAGVVCTVGCDKDADCPRLGNGKGAARCNINQQNTCDMPCGDSLDCVENSGLACIALAGLDGKPMICTNVF